MNTQLIMLTNSDQVVFRIISSSAQKKIEEDKSACAYSFPIKKSIYYEITTVDIWRFP